jgi:uncharacterized protein
MKGGRRGPHVRAVTLDPTPQRFYRQGAGGSSAGPVFRRCTLRLSRLLTVDPAGRTELHYAALANDLPAAEARLTAGDDPNASDKKGFTPLHVAAQERAAAVARLLLDHGAEVDRANVYGNTPLFTAVFNSRGDGSVIRLLREHGADVLRENRSGQTPLGLARLIANYDVAQFFDVLQ